MQNDRTGPPESKVDVNWIIVTFTELHHSIICIFTRIKNHISQKLLKIEKVHFLRMLNQLTSKTNGTTIIKISNWQNTPYNIYIQRRLKNLFTLTWDLAKVCMLFFCLGHADDWRVPTFSNSNSSQYCHTAHTASSASIKQMSVPRD